MIQATVSDLWFFFHPLFVKFIAGFSEWRKDGESHSSSSFRHRWFWRSCNWIPSPGTYHQWLFMDWASPTYWQETSGWI